MPNVENIDSIDNLDEMQIVAIPVDEVGMQIREYHPEKDGKGKPSEVHLLIDAGADTLLALRFMEPDTLRTLVGALSVHATNVWPGGSK